MSFLLGHPLLQGVEGNKPIEVNCMLQEVVCFQLPGVAVSYSGDLPNPGIEPMSPASPTLAGRFFTTIINWEALNAPGNNRNPESRLAVSPLVKDVRICEEGTFMEIKMRLSVQMGLPKTDFSQF